jgi:hypothetical protein
VTGTRTHVPVNGRELIHRTQEASLWKWGAGKLFPAMPIVLESLDEQVASDRTADAAYHVLPGIVAVLQVGRDSDGHARCKTDPWLRECADDRGSGPSCECPRARIMFHRMWG